MGGYRIKLPELVSSGVYPTSKSTLWFKQNLFNVPGDWQYNDNAEFLIIFDVVLSCISGDPTSKQTSFRFLISTCIVLWHTNLYSWWRHKKVWDNLWDSVGPTNHSAVNNSMKANYRCEQGCNQTWSLRESPFAYKCWDILNLGSVPGASPFCIMMWCLKIPVGRGHVYIYAPCNWSSTTTLFQCSRSSKRSMDNIKTGRLLSNLKILGVDFYWCENCWRVLQVCRHNCTFRLSGQGTQQSQRSSRHHCTQAYQVIVIWHHPLFFCSKCSILQMQLWSDHTNWRDKPFHRMGRKSYSNVLHVIVNEEREIRQISSRYIPYNQLYFCFWKSVIAILPIILRSKLHLVCFAILVNWCLRKTG